MSGGYTETFQRGAFARTIAERGDRVKFLAHHDRRSMPLGRAVRLREDAAGLYGEFRVSNIGFEPIPSRDVWSRDRSAVTRTEVRLHEVSAVSFPAYESALISGVREAAPTLPVDAARRRLDLITRTWM